MASPNNSVNYNGVLLVNKPSGITSHDAVLEVRRTLGLKKIGHTGTLDPAAEGLLVLCLGPATKIARFLSDADKQYDAEITLGLTSETYDAEGVDPDETPAAVPELSTKAVEEILAEYTGTIQQQVPAYSAIKVDGERLYKAARAGKKVEAPEREITIECIDLLSFESPRLAIRVTCSKGTYIRSLAHDIGQRLGCGGYLSALNRLRVGTLRLENALSLEEVRGRHEVLMTPGEALDLAAVTVKDDFCGGVAHGREITHLEVQRIDRQFLEGDTVAVKDDRGRLLALGRALMTSSQVVAGETGRMISYLRVLH